MSTVVKHNALLNKYSQVVRQRVLIPPFHWFESSYPATKSEFATTVLGYRQVVRQRILIPPLPRFES